MKITDLLDRPIAYHRVFVTLTGSVKAAVLLSQAVYWQKRTSRKDGWFYKSYGEWEDETGLTRREMDTARRDCEKYLLTDLRGVPATLFWKVDEDALVADLFQFVQNVQTGMNESAKQVSAKRTNINRTETTTETTTNEDEALAQISQAYEKEIGPLTPMIADELKSASVEFLTKWVLDAIHEAAIQNKRGWKYVLAILNRWKAQGNQADAKKQTVKANTTEVSQPKGFDAARRWLERKETANG